MSKINSKSKIPSDVFLTFAYNMKVYFGVKPIKDWMVGNEWGKTILLLRICQTKKVIRNALNQVNVPLHPKAWNKTCRIS